MADDDLTTELLHLERRGWDALCAGTGADFYGEVMAEEGVMVVGNGTVLDREAVLSSLHDSPPWTRYSIDSVRLVPAGPESAALVYTTEAFRDGDAPAFTGAMTSLYRRQDGGWRLAVHTQTPLP